MSRLKLTNPPTIKAKSSRDFGDWLRENFYDHTCAYCGVPQDSTLVEHYEPVNFRPKRRLDPGNLLLACNTCNHPSVGKGDYHPKHKSRRRFKGDKSGFLVIHPERVNYSDMFSIDQGTGNISPRGESLPHYTATKNIVLLRLDRSFLNYARHHALQVLALSEMLYKRIQVDAPNMELQALFDVQLKQISRLRIFYYLFDIQMPPVLTTLVAPIRPRPLAVPETTVS